ncbi:hypothetical protein QFC20_007782, partial [Naganishia adeliensis]
MQSHFFPPDGGPSGFDYGAANVTIEPLLGNVTSAPSDAYLAFFPSGLGVLGMISHLLTHPKIKDWLQLILLGLAAEFTRRLSGYLLVWAREIFCITSAHATSDDSYDWLMTYWMQDKRWKDRCRKFDCEVSKVSGRARMRPWMKSEENNSIGDKTAPPKPRYVPRLGETHIVRMGAVFIMLHRKENKKAAWYYDKECLEVTMLTFSREKFQDLLALAKTAFIADEEAKITIKMIDESKDDGEWRQVAKKHKRPLTSVVTEAVVKERLERDILEFCQSEEWYISRGDPWRRGFLLHGVPGSGKTSLIHSLASACDLDIYVVSLATKGMTDSKLNRCMTAV